MSVSGSADEVSHLWLDALHDTAALAEADPSSATVRVDCGDPSLMVPGGDDLKQRMRVIDREPGGDYQLLEMLGRGGMGRVYLARQAGVGRMVALKRIARKASAYDCARFVAEAQVTGGLSHPNIIPIYEMGVDTNGRLFYSMRAIMGATWSRIIKELDFDRNRDALGKVCDAVAYAHSRGVLHRDLKPANVMLGDFGEVQVMDWGLSARIQDGPRDHPDSLVGTPSYMAPEMARGAIDDVDERTDIYLLGGILYEILTGHPPHYAPHCAPLSVQDCLERAAHNHIVEPVEPVPPEQREWFDIALHAMRTEPADRYAGVSEFAGALRAAERHRESETLCARGESCLSRARRSGAYEDFARAQFCFEEALALWVGNVRAHDGAIRTRAIYAEQAMQRGDFDLADSLLEQGEPVHEPITSRLTRMRREQTSRRLRRKSTDGA
ncbi:MAG: serine/threonine-protein kinase [Planctomycetota bacterium]